MTTTIQQSAINSWRTVIGKIRVQARDAYSRTLSLDQRVLYVHNYLLAKAWYTPQTLPSPSDYTRQLNRPCLGTCSRATPFGSYSLPSTDVKNTEAWP